MEKEAIQLIIDTQRKFFASGKTLDIKYRIAVLKKLRSLIILYEKDILDALYNDFHKPEFENPGEPILRSSILFHGA